MQINIEVIPHNNHRYETVGDYWVDEAGVQQVRVSDMGDKRYEFLVALHELIELTLCEQRGIKEEDISAFDIEFEKNRKPGNEEEPGDQPEAPYHKEHVFAECLERLMARELGVNWQKYTDAVMSL